MASPTSTTEAEGKDNGAHLYVKGITGQAIQIPYKKTLTIKNLKWNVMNKMKIAIEKQRLIYDGNILKETNADDTDATIVTYGIQPKSTIHLLVLLSAIAPDLSTVVFDLYWGWPDTGKDYLDASALAFSGKKYEGVADYKTLKFADKAVYHSGDRIDKAKRQGHHLIRVNLKDLPKSVTDVYFTLSSWNSPEISKFKSLNFRFFDQDHPEKMLCADQTKKGEKSQAIVMCSLSRMDDHWYVHNNGVVSDGNCKNYQPLIETIQKIIDEVSP